MNKDILNKVYELAKIRHQKYLNTESDTSHPSSTELLEIICDEEENDELLQYLKGLTYEENLMIITVMYIGRDFSIVDDIKKYKSPDHIFQEWQKDLRNTFSENNQTINQINQKMPLDEYLENAFKILDL